MLNKILKDPYRLFFVVGFSYLLIGVGLWMNIFFSEEFYPIVVHRYLVINGFMFSFIAGFLFTAVPRFSSAPALNFSEAISFFIVTLVGFIFVLYDQESFGYLVTFFQSLIILSFLAKRMGVRKQNPPFTFVFMFFGIALNGLFGLLRFFSVDDFILMNDFIPITLIIMGIGGRLIPGVLGHVEIVAEQRKHYEKPLPLFKVVPGKVYGIIIVFIVSLFLPTELSYGLYGLGALYWGFAFCQLQSFPKKRSSLTWGVWLATWLLVIGLMVQALNLDNGIHFAHSLFIGSFTLLTILIATRVLQAHSVQDPKLENTKTLWAFIILTIMAMLTRISAHVMIDTYLNHLGYAGFLLVIAILIWAKKYLILSFVFPEESKPKDR